MCDCKNDNKNKIDSIMFNNILVIMHELGKAESKLETIKNMLCNPDNFVSGEDIRHAMGWEMNSKEEN